MDGLDANYFRKNLERIARDVESYTPQEIETALERLADVAAGQGGYKQKNKALEARIAELESMNTALEVAVRNHQDIIKFQQKRTDDLDIWKSNWLAKHDAELRKSVLEEAASKIHLSTGHRDDSHRDRLLRMAQGAKE
jgi:ATP-dependent protease Clp ATPase subunit